MFCIFTVIIKIGVELLAIRVIFMLFKCNLLDKTNFLKHNADPVQAISPF